MKGTFTVMMVSCTDMPEEALN